MKKKIDVFDYANDIMKGLEKGVLLTTKTEDKVNTMTISWGKLGVEWAKRIFVVYVRQSRFTKEQLDKNPEFTINIPVGDYEKKILGLAGTKSGHNVDKIEELGLTLEEAEKISVPGIKELPLTLECKVIYKQEQDLSAISEGDRNTFYPEDVAGDFHGANRDHHTAYYGEIVDAYIIE
jgi:flavin reductase (DIM6/NTAB) family NADH-FMN oxidoreductase RutF